MGTIRTKNELRFNFNVNHQKEVFQKCKDGDVMFSDEYVKWLEDEWLQAKGTKTSDSGLNIDSVMPRTFKNGLAILLKPNYRAKDGSIKAAYETTVDGHRKWLAPMDDLYGA